MRDRKWVELHGRRGVEELGWVREGKLKSEYSMGGKKSMLNKRKNIHRMHEKYLGT